MNESPLKILYLAKYAPLSEDYVPEFHDKDGVAPIYHNEIFLILKKLGYKVEGSRSLDYLYQNSKILITFFVCTTGYLLKIARFSHLLCVSI